MAKKEKIKDTVILLPRSIGANNKKRRPAGAGRFENTATLNSVSIQKVCDLSSRRLVQRLRDEVLAQLMNYEVKPGT